LTDVQFHYVHLAADSLSALALSVDPPEDREVGALLVRVGAWGNVRNTTFRAFDKKELDAIISKMDDTI